jgi:hypothetical protein
VAPSAEVALALEAVGFNQGLDTSGQHLTPYRQPDLFASYGRIANHKGHLTPLRDHDRENDLIDLDLRNGRWEAHLIPLKRAADLRKLVKRNQARKSIKHQLQQLGIQLDDGRLKRGGAVFTILFEEK